MREFAGVKPDGSVTEIVAFPDTPVVIGTATELIPGANETVVGTEATVGVSLLTATWSVVLPASTSLVPCGVPVSSSQTANSPTVSMVPLAAPPAEDGNSTIEDGARATACTASVKPAELAVTLPLP